MREIKIKYFYSDGHKIFNRVFTLQEIEQGLQFDEICDCPLLKDFKIIHRFQYTGLDDKNDVEIYESDIVKLIGTIGETTTIEFIDGAFYVVGYGLVSDWISEGGEWNNIEKLGNIWENPELLKAKS